MRYLHASRHRYNARMRSRRLQFLVSLLIPFLVLRALLPAGFMPVADEGQLRFALCSIVLASQTGDADTGTQGGQELPASATDCPFAIAHAVAFAPPLQHVLTVVEPQRSVHLLYSSVSLPLATGPPRVATVRGPPHSS